MQSRGKLSKRQPTACIAYDINAYRSRIIQPSRFQFSQTCFMCLFVYYDSLDKSTVTMGLTALPAKVIIYPASKIS